MEDRLPRKLVAIVYADVAGYSRLTGQDEDSTHRRLSDYLNVFTETVARHGGCVLHYAGDAILADFEAVSDALNCAAHIQRDLERKNRHLPDSKKVQFRIGVNLGDVIEDRGDIYGDNVNVAARLQTLAEPGGICVSESVQSAIARKLPLNYEYLGEVGLKNISQPLKAYRARMMPDEDLPPPKAVREAPFRKRLWAAGIFLAVAVVVSLAIVTWLQPWRTSFEPAATARMAFPLPAKPSIAVLAFDSLSNDPDVEHLSDGISENVIAVLSKVPELFVIARNSSFAYKGKMVSPSEVAEDLGVQYILQGSLQRESGRIRVTAQLIDALKGVLLWAETYDRTLEDIFTVQDELALNIVQSLQVNLTTGAGRFLLRSSTQNLKAWENYTSGLSLWRRFNKEDNYRARLKMEQAIKHDPEWAIAHQGLGWTHVMDALYEWSEDSEYPLHQAELLARKALAIDETVGNAHGLLARIHTIRGEYEQALIASRRALEVEPNNPSVIVTFAFTELYSGNIEEAIMLSKKAERLQPMTPPAWLDPQTIGYYLTGRYKDAISVARRAIQDQPDAREQARVFAIASYAALRKPEDARPDVIFILEHERNFSVRRWVELSSRRYRDKSFRDLLVKHLLEAGLPE